MIARGHLAAIQLATRAAVGAGLAVLAAQQLQLQYPLYALIAAVIVTDTVAAQTRKLAWRRMAGTIIGAGVGAALSPLLAVRPIAVAIAVLGTMLLCHALRLDGSARVSGYIAGIVVLEFSAEPWRYAAARLLETTLGVAVALALSAVPLLLRERRRGGDNR